MCVSCHTQATYGLARPALRNDRKEQGPSAAEQAMLASIQKRVRMWNEVLPFYSDAVYGDGKEVESRNAEAVLNAVILPATTRGICATIPRDWPSTTHGRCNRSPGRTPAHGCGKISTTRRGSRRNRNITGRRCWPKLSPTRRTTIATIRRSVGNLAALRIYLTSHYESQPLLNKIVVLWASAQFPGLLTPPQRKPLLRGHLRTPARRRRLEPDGPGHVAKTRQHSARRQAGRVRHRDHGARA